MLTVTTLIYSKEVCLGCLLIPIEFLNIDRFIFLEALLPLDFLFMLK